VSGYFEGRHALAGIAKAEERIAFGMTAATFMELIRADDCFVIREFDFFDGNTYTLDAAYSAEHIAALWQRLTGDVATHHALTGRLP
jgi:hypothetical protein